MSRGRRKNASSDTRRYFGEKLKLAEAAKPTNPSSSLIKVSPIVNGTQILCVGGRIGEAPLPFGARYHVEHPSKNFSSVVGPDAPRDPPYFLVHERETNGEGDFRPCIRCVLFWARAVTSEMAAVPSFRLGAFSPAFAHTVVNLLGPYSIKIN